MNMILHPYLDSEQVISRLVSRVRPIHLAVRRAIEAQEYG